MRSILQIMVVALLSCAQCAVGADETRATKIKTLYSQGLRAVKQGEVESARTYFQQVLRLNKRHVNARFQLKQLELNGGRLQARKRQLQLKAVTIPQIDFDGVTLTEALETLSALVEKQTNKKFSPNFVINDPNEVLADRKFSLKLGSLPASAILDLALQNARATARYDQHAILIRPLEGKKKTSSPAKPEKPTTKAEPKRKLTKPDPFE